MSYNFTAYFVGVAETDIGLSAIWLIENRPFNSGLIRQNFHISLAIWTVRFSLEHNLLKYFIFWETTVHSFSVRLVSIFTLIQSIEYATFLLLTFHKELLVIICALEIQMMMMMRKRCQLINVNVDVDVQSILLNEGWQMVLQNYSKSCLTQFR